MNLDSCTPGQRQIITTLDKPLMVSAGAGSGKTFTLTQRIAYALETTSGKAAFAQSVDQILAITFTKKAAAELKSRIKHRLLDMGLIDESLKVDDAWISTIHGMCSRILREHALELGIDPSFEVISETESLRLKDEAFNRVMFAIETGEEAALRSYIHSVGIHSNANNSASIAAYVERVTNRCLALPKGFDALVMPSASGNPSVLLREMISLAETFIATSDALKKPTKTDEKHKAACEDALRKAYSYLEKGVAESFDDPAFDARAFASVVFEFPKTSAKYRTKESDPVFYEEYRQQYAHLAGVIEAALSAQEQQFIVEISRRVQDQYQALKGPTSLDNVDLLRMTYDALVNYPDLALHYRNQFKMIMIDEFQDTDELQVAVLEVLAQAGMSNVCTVGDAQQSIYRFRGADVEVFFDFRHTLEVNYPEAQFVSLPDNFRSHADVLSLVDTVFSQREVFGDRFLRLAPKGKVNDTPDPLFDTRPRIGAALFDCRSGGPGVSQGRIDCAKRIAEHFVELRGAGASSSDMALLLGSMSNVAVYTQALRDAGFECLVSGGSTFSESVEVLLIKSIVRFLSNRIDDEALFQVLDSALFSLSDNAFAHLTTQYDQEGKPHRRTLSKGLWSWQSERGLTNLSEAERDNMDFAFGCLDHAYKILDQFGMAVAVKELFRSSGWFIRMQHQGAQGQAMVGNVYKALRMLEEIESEGLGVVRCADRFIKDCETLKLAPGTLSTTASNFVKIMTVHASKGLEFPHVALAELRLDSKSDIALVENIEGKTYCAFKPVALSSVRDTAKALHDFQEPFEGIKSEVLTASDEAERIRALGFYVKQQELSEARRLLYVALTRASKSLFMGIVYQGKKEPSYEGKGILEDLYSALRWEPNAQAPVQYLDYGGSKPLCLEFKVLEEKNTEVELEKEKAVPFLIPAQPPQSAPFTVPFSTTHDEVCSYSSLQSFSDQGVNSNADDPNTDDPFVVEPSSVDATRLGTAFHRLAQGAIDARGAGELIHPTEEQITAQIALNDLMPDQASRLRTACTRWFESRLAHQFAQHAYLYAEIPFMIEITRGQTSFFLEGEIDALAVDSCLSDADSIVRAERAFLVDYKTGGSPLETDQELCQKHLLQAQCYALALLRQGYSEVDAWFVRVEQADRTDSSEPQVVSYHFIQADQDQLEQVIWAAYQTREG